MKDNSVSHMDIIRTTTDEYTYYTLYKIFKNDKLYCEEKVSKEFGEGKQIRYYRCWNCDRHIRMPETHVPSGASFSMTCPHCFKTI